MFVEYIYPGPSESMGQLGSGQGLSSFRDPNSVSKFLIADISFGFLTLSFRKKENRVYHNYRQYLIYELFDIEGNSCKC